MYLFTGKSLERMASRREALRIPIKDFKRLPLQDEAGESLVSRAQAYAEAKEYKLAHLVAVVEMPNPEKPLRGKHRGHAERIEELFQITEKNYDRIRAFAEADGLTVSIYVTSANLVPLGRMELVTQYLAEERDKKQLSAEAGKGIRDRPRVAEVL